MKLAITYPCLPEMQSSIGAPENKQRDKFLILSQWPIDELRVVGGIAFSARNELSIEGSSEL